MAMVSEALFDDLGDDMGEYGGLAFNNSMLNGSFSYPSENSGFNDNNSQIGNVSKNFTCSKQDNFLQPDTVSGLVVMLLYSVVLLTAVSGNSLVLYVVGSNRSMQTVTNLFIANLAVSDLLVSFTSLWLTPVYLSMGRWIWGEVLCHALPFTQGASIFISALTLTSIAVDRYIVILHPLKSRISVQACVTTIVTIWLISLALVTPYAVHMRVIHITNCDKEICGERWPFPEVQKSYGIVVTVLQFVVPFILIGFCYARIWWYLSQRSRTTMIKASATDVQRKKRLLKMLVCMVVIFVVCWLPFNVLNLLRDFGFARLIARHFKLYFILAHLASMTATCWNPIVYAWMNDNFRREFKAALPCFFGAVERVRARTRSASSRRRGGTSTGGVSVTSSAAARRRLLTRLGKINNSSVDTPDMMTRNGSLLSFNVTLNPNSGTASQSVLQASPAGTSPEQLRRSRLLRNSAASMATTTTAQISPSVTEDCEEDKMMTELTERQALVKPLSFEGAQQPLGVRFSNGIVDELSEEETDVQL